MIYLFDIEGTITDINFVQNVLFPYSKNNLETFIQENQTKKEILKALDEIKKTVLQEPHSKIDFPIETLLTWIDEDRKHPALKEIQGHIWEYGYKNGDFKGHVYPDAFDFFSKLKKYHYRLAIYSSGSIKAQKLLLSHTEFGDLTPWFEFYFDTSIGHKKDAQSYLNIKKEVNDKIVFFSDMEEELEAAKSCGIFCYRLVRGQEFSSQFPCLSDFYEFNLD